MTQTRKEPAETNFEKPLTVHFLRVLTKSEENEDCKSHSNLNPTIKRHCSTSRHRYDPPPILAVNQTPAVRNQGHDGVLVKCIELNWQKSEDERY